MVRSASFLLLWSLMGYITPSPPSLTLSLEDLVPLKREFYPELLSVQWISRTEFLYSEYENGLLIYDAAKNSIRTCLSEDILIHLGNYTRFTFSMDGEHLLLMTDRRKVYRYSSLSYYYVYNIRDRGITRLNESPIQVVKWGTQKSLAYVKDNNVYYVPNVATPEQNIQLTSDGVPGQMYYGTPDWIYEEEIFDSNEAMWFSPKGTYLAVASFNDTNVENVFYTRYGDPFNLSNQYPGIVGLKYPKAGRTNPVVGLRVYRLQDPGSTPFDIPPPVDIVGVDHILGRVNWASKDNLIVFWLNRRQSTSALVNCDLEKYKCSIVKERSEPTGWISIYAPLFDKTGSKMLDIEPLFYNGLRYLHVSMFDFDTLLTEDWSPGNSTVTNILGWNEELSIIYYTVSPWETPWKRQVWASTRDANYCITCEEQGCNYAMSSFSLDGSYGVIMCSSSNVVPKFLLYRSEDHSFKTLKNNSRLAETLSQYKLPTTVHSVVNLGENVNAHVQLLLPPDFHKGRISRKFPLIVKVYAGPGTSRVKANYELAETYNLYLASNRSYIVASIDVRGSDVMGADAMFAVHNALGTIEITDTLSAIEYLVQHNSYIDPTRIGVWGWSYGGYAATMMLMQDKARLITCGVAVAPVTSWKFYDSIYTERYMDTPQANPGGYERADALLAAEKLRGRSYLLVHGTGDDNVHYQHSMQLAKELQHLDITFEQMSYVDENHSLMGVSRHLYHTLDHFWTQCFNETL